MLQQWDLNHAQKIEVKCIYLWAKSKSILSTLFSKNPFSKLTRSFSLSFLTYTEGKHLFHRNGKNVIVRKKRNLRFLNNIV